MFIIMFLTTNLYIVDMLYVYISTNYTVSNWHKKLFYFIQI